MLEEKAMKLQSLSLQVRQLESENQVLTKQLESAKLTIQNKDFEIERQVKHHKHLSDTEQLLVSANQKLKSLFEQKASLEKDLESKSAQTSELMSKLRELTGRMTNLIAENNKLKEDGIHIKQRYSEKRSLSEKPKKDKVKLSEELEIIRLENQELKKSNDRLRESEGNLKRNIEEMTKNLSLQIDELLQKVKMAEAEKLKLIE